jgi:hypothetical protein
MPTGRDGHTDTTGLLRASDPAGRLALAGPRIEGALDALGAAIAASPVSPLRRRLPRPVLALAIGLAVIVIGGGVAAGAVLSAHTGKTVPPAQIPMGGPGEELNSAAPDFRSVALQIASDIPYPNGYASWRNLVVSLYAGDGTPAGSAAEHPSNGVPSIVSSGALHGFFAMSAFCAWVRDWDHAVGAGDDAEAATAAATIAEAPTWKAVTAEDPHPDPNAVNDPGAETGTLFGWLLPYRAAVLAGDRARVEQLLASGYGDGRCSLYDPALNP